MKLLASRNIVTIRQGSGTYIANTPGMVEDPLGFTFIEDKQNLVVSRLIPIINSSIPLLIDITGSSLKQEIINIHRAVTEAIASHNSIKAQDFMYLHLVYNRTKIISE